MANIEDAVRELSPAALGGAQISTSYVMVRCPFHGGGTEKTPSCSLSRMKPVFFCHSCGKSGHITKYLRELGAPIDAAKKIVERLNYDYSEFGGKTRTAIFSGLNPYRGKFILDDDILDNWRLKPEQLTAAGFKERTLRHFEVGMDFRTGRITYPIRNIYGDLVGVSGRTVMEGGDGPRYKIYSAKDLAFYGIDANYSTEAIKGAVLWHAHLVFPIAFHTRAPMVVVEGFKAAMWVWQMGYHNVVALIGSHLTRLQAELLARTASDIILFLDNNSAGWKGTVSAGNLLVSKNLVKVARYPDLRQQPDALTEAEVRQAITSPVHFVPWKLQQKEMRHV